MCNATPFAGTGSLAQLKHLLDQVPVLQAERMMATLLTTLSRLMIVFSQLRDCTLQCLQEHTDAGLDAENRYTVEGLANDVSVRPDDARTPQQSKSSFSSPRTLRKLEPLTTSQVAPSTPTKGCDYGTEASRLLPFFFYCQ